jgi:predicted transcriptional regulator
MMARFGLVELVKGRGGTIIPRVPYEAINLHFPMKRKHEARLVGRATTGLRERIG